MNHGDHPRFHLGIFGASGTGKTTYGLRFISGAKASCVFCFDPDGEFSCGLGVPPARTVFELDAAIPTGLVCFDPHTLFAGRLEEALEYFARLGLAAGARLRGRKLFVVDELGWYVSGNNIGHWLRVLVQSGRRKAGIDGVFLAQAPNELHNFVRAQLTEVVCFQLTEDCALEYPKKFGFDVEALRTLPPFEFICRNNRGQEVRG
jgi:hypothetical protein